MADQVDDIKIIMASDMNLCNPIYLYLTTNIYM